ncbi:hypothetical protein RBSH_03320 [Rhodopirellula baltica SH28]|uniref:Uncharacterized protein n=1 Tax=Rhodopirellula baltica SH28 TaxID=993517 RepID=K5D435_RHOBT|nr:hypothetical protein RBSH_03320 [Rhodopirellula baltica SH28]
MLDRIQTLLKPNASSAGRPGQKTGDDFEEFCNKKMSVGICGGFLGRSVAICAANRTCKERRVAFG